MLSLFAHSFDHGVNDPVFRRSKVAQSQVHGINNNLLCLFRDAAFTASSEVKFDHVIVESTHWSFISEICIVVKLGELNQDFNDLFFVIWWKALMRLASEYSADAFKDKLRS